MNYNYHTHTYMCSHASGTPEEYIQKAIDGGIKYMGFSDHIPHINKDGIESFYRIPCNKGEEYIAKISALKEKYKDKIEISVGFESEYYPEVFDEMLDRAIKLGGEYLILGAHYLSEEDAEHTLFPRDSYEFLKEYVSNVTKAIESGVFTYVAHPDIVNFTGDFDIYKEEMRKICKASYEYNIPLEINFLGIRDNRSYPYEPFWQIAGEEKSPVTFGFDAHTVDGACDLQSLQKAEKMIKKYNLNYIGKPEIIKLNR